MLKRIKGNKKILVLDGLRGYAALMIFLAHTPQITNSEIGVVIKQFIMSSKMAYFGVDVFFVLSGFLITRILLKAKKENRFSFKNFYIKRALRIFPIYYLCIIFCGFLFTWKGMGETSLYLSNYYFSFSAEPHPLRHTWSLAVEEHYYFIWPFVIYLFGFTVLKKYLFGVVFFIVLVFAFLTFNYLEFDLAQTLVYKSSHFRMLSLAAGSYLAFFETKLRSISTNSMYFLFVAFVLVYLMPGMFNNSIFAGMIPSSLVALFSFCLASVLLFVFVLNIEERNNFIRKIFVNKPILFLGKISYGFYLFHFPVFYYFKIDPKQLNVEYIEPWQFVLPLLASFIIPILSYYCIEKPILKYKSRLTNYSYQEQQKVYAVK